MNAPVLTDTPSPTRPAFALFSGLPERLVDQALLTMERRAFAGGEVVLRENDRNEVIFVIESGEFEVWKGPPRSQHGVCIARLGPGDCFGEMSAVGGESAAATIVASSAATVRSTSLSALPSAEGFRQVVTDNLSRTLVRRLSHANGSIHQKHQQEVHALQVVAAASAFITRMLAALACYMFSLPLIAIIIPYLVSDSLISFFFIVIFSWVVLNFRNRWPEVAKHHWHMTTAGWPRALLRGLVWTIPPGLVFVAVKLSAMYFRPGHYEFFEPMTAIARGKPMNYGVWFSLAAVYTVLCFAQEYIRCAIQGTLAMIHSTLSSGGPWKALLISNVVFASIHTHLGTAFTIQAFIGGLFFGYEFQKERSYLAVATSHSLFGVWAVFVVGIPR